MATDFDGKLRIAQRVTGSLTQAEMRTLFEAVNPATGYTPERAYKWISGKSVPRDPAIYQDLGQLLDLTVPAETIRTCSLEVFERLVAERHGPLDPEPSPEQMSATDAALPGYLAGRYLTFAWATSTAKTGMLVLGCLEVGADGENPPRLSYAERLPGGDVHLEGRLERSSRSLHAATIGPELDMQAFFCFAKPPPPGLALLGTVCGLAFHDAEARPMAGRMIGVKSALKERDALLAMTGYLHPRERDIAACLESAEITGRPDACARAILGLIAKPDKQGVLEISPAEINAILAGFYG